MNVDATIFILPMKTRPLMERQNVEPSGIWPWYGQEIKGSDLQDTLW